MTTTEPRKIECKEIAKELKSRLTKTYKGVKFSVKSDFNSINVVWQDGPSQKQVQEMLDPYVGYERYMNGYNEDYRRRFVDRDGETVWYGLRYTHLSRRHSAEALQQAAKEVCEQHDLDLSLVEIDPGTDRRAPFVRSWGNQSVTDPQGTVTDLEMLIYRHVRSVSFCQPSQPKAKKQVPAQPQEDPTIAEEFAAPAPAVEIIRQHKGLILIQGGRVA